MESAQRLNNNLDSNQNTDKTKCCAIIGVDLYFLIITQDVNENCLGTVQLSILILEQNTSWFDCKGYTLPQLTSLTCEMTILTNNTN